MSEVLQAAVVQAAESGQQLCLRGGNSKGFYGRELTGEPFDLSKHQGIVNYEPTELVVTARSGTPLSEIEAALAAQHQMLPFEPPHFTEASTIGGAIASGLSGPRRPWFGAPRDLLLGIKLLDGRGQILNFGGQVMKNVAGYDLSRLMAGSLGTLGILLEVSIKVLPLPPQETTLLFEADTENAHAITQRLRLDAAPISGSCHMDRQLHIRLECDETRVLQLRNRFGGEMVEDADMFWRALRDQQFAFFQTDAPLWRLSMPPAADFHLPGKQLTEWGGALRWFKGDHPMETIRSAVSTTGGHATLFRNGDRSGEIFHPLNPTIALLHRRLKQVFDPKFIFNPGRLYPE
ncbi:MAG: glycolate oxidase subunit GlcE [gamma proteobacterium endosymbiont of Lamellibrachia anaximandri]|nr:glycolate oxidase subunit GlcE [gamma proteobacterium endosymbiont of Lamellibrachia anaximandri]